MSWPPIKHSCNQPQASGFRARKVEQQIWDMYTQWKIENREVGSRAVVGTHFSTQVPAYQYSAFIGCIMYPGIIFITRLVLLLAGTWVPVFSSSRKPLPLIHHWVFLNMWSHKLYEKAKCHLHYVLSGHGPFSFRATMENHIEDLLFDSRLTFLVEARLMFLSGIIK